MQERTQEYILRTEAAQSGGVEETWLVLSGNSGAGGGSR